MGVIPVIINHSFTTFKDYVESELEGGSIVYIWKQNYAGIRFALPTR